MVKVYGFTIMRLLTLWASFVRLQKLFEPVSGTYFVGNWALLYMRVSAWSCEFDSCDLVIFIRGCVPSGRIRRFSRCTYVFFLQQVYCFKTPTCLHFKWTWGIMLAIVSLFPGLRVDSKYSWLCESNFHLPIPILPNASQVVSFILWL